jgi:hypothetical protein
VRRNRWLKAQTPFTSIPVASSEKALVAAVDLADSTSAKDTLTLASTCTYRMTSSHNGHQCAAGHHHA